MNNIRASLSWFIIISLISNLVIYLVGTGYSTPFLTATLAMILIIILLLAEAYYFKKHPLLTLILASANLLLITIFQFSLAIPYGVISYHFLNAQISLQFSKRTCYIFTGITSILFVFSSLPFSNLPYVLFSLLGLFATTKVVFSLIHENNKLQNYSEGLKEQACRDYLTGLYNHGYFQKQLAQEVKMAKSTNENISLLMIDVDHFKYYNDCHGHPKGDTLLNQLAILLHKNTRNHDIVARYGGEEFAIILPNTTLKQAIEIAERIRQEIELFEFEGESTQPSGKITISIGIATYPNHANSPSQLLEIADQCLYKAKPYRNKVEFNELIG